MILESYLGATESYLGEVTADPNQYIEQFKTRFQSMDVSQALNFLTSLLEAHTASIKRITELPRGELGTSQMQSAADAYAIDMGAKTGFEIVHGQLDSLKATYPTYIDRLNSALTQLGNFAEYLSAYDPSFGDNWQHFIQQRDAAIKEGRLDDPIVHPDLKLQIIRMAYKEPNNMDPTVVENVTSQFTDTGANKTTSEAPSAPTSGIDIKRLAVAAIAAFFAYKALT